MVAARRHGYPPKVQVEREGSEQTMGTDDEYGKGAVMDTTHTGNEEVRVHTDPTAYALGSEDGEALWFFGTLLIFKATSEQTGGRFSLVEQLAPRGMATPLNVHREDDESF